MLTKTLKRLNLATRPAMAAMGLNHPVRAYNLSLVDRVKETFHNQIRHIRSFVEPDGQNYESQLPDGYRTHGNTAAHFSASITNNSFEMHQWHEMDAVVHTQFGTVDNPVLIFTSDSSWRIVICAGPAVEDDSIAHEKMYYMVREGPMHRCQVCGQCFKIVRLKDEASEKNDYYSTMFASINHFEVAEEDMTVNLNLPYGDRPNGSLQTIATTNVYIHANNDEADRIMVDPAYKLERMREATEKVYALHEAYRLVDEQMKGMSYSLKLPFSRDLYETWYNIEKSIAKFDRIFNKVEKFNARALSDPYNHERRERRMIQRRNERWNRNYTYFFGNLTEEEQQYRDYFQSDLDIQMEDDYVDEKMDEAHIAQIGTLNPNLYDFQDYNARHDPHEDYSDIVEQRIFKYKYRQMADDSATFKRRQARVISRFLERAQNRDPALEQDLFDLFATGARDYSWGQLATNPDAWNDVALQETRPFREYMVKEATQQYRDYFESDGEDEGFFEYLDNLSNRDKIRMMEIFEDFTTDKLDNKDYVSIPKREYNPELSLLGNVVLDLVDFKDRIRPLSQDISMLEHTRKYQKRNPVEFTRDRAEFDSLIDNIRGKSKISNEGYSSGELSEPKTDSERNDEKVDREVLQSSDADEERK